LSDPARNTANLDTGREWNVSANSLPFVAANPAQAKADAMPPKRRRHRPRVKPLVADAQLLARLLGVGIRSIRTWANAGKLPPSIRLGSRVVWSIREIRGWVDAGAPDCATWEKIKPKFM